MPGTRDKFRAFDEIAGRERVRVCVFRNLRENGRVQYATTVTSYYRKGARWSVSSSHSSAQLALLISLSTEARVYIKHQEELDRREKRVPREIVVERGDRIEVSKLTKSLGEVVQ